MGVTTTTQLSLFDTIRTVLRTNSTISQKFGLGDFYMFDPHVKSQSFKGYPFWLIEIPSIKGTELLTLNHGVTDKRFEVTITLYMDYFARDKLIDYCNAAVYQIDASEDTFDALGYHNLRLSLTGVRDEIRDQHDIVVAEFSLTLDGDVCR